MSLAIFQYFRPAMQYCSDIFRRSLPLPQTWYLSSPAMLIFMRRVHVAWRIYSRRTTGRYDWTFKTNRRRDIYQTFQLRSSSMTLQTRHLCDLLTSRINCTSFHSPSSALHFPFLSFLSVLFIFIFERKLLHPVIHTAFSAFHKILCFQSLTF